MKQQIEQEIKKAITRHLVQHVQVPKEDTRDRIDILADEAATAILKNQPWLLCETHPATCGECGMPAHPVLGAVCAAEDCPGTKK